MTILILGATGLLGSELFKQSLAEKENVIGIASRKSTHENIIQADLTQVGVVSDIVRNVQPEIVVNCAALTNLNQCEKSYIDCDLLHVQMIRELASCCQRLIHISTDSIFDGMSSDGYTELSVPNPLNNYSKSKYLGEKYINTVESLIIRTNIFGKSPNENGNSFFDWICQNANGEEITGYDNVFFNPVSVISLAKFILLAIKENITGVLNVSSSRKLSKYEFVELVIGKLQGRTKVLKGSYINSTIKRPLNTYLIPRKLNEQYNLSFNIEDEIDLVIAENVHF